MRTIRSSKGFTLIELMIVVVIIGILAALAIPRFNQASARAKEKEADGILKQIYTLQQTYFANNGVYATDFGSPGLQDVGWEGPATMTWYSMPASPDLPATMLRTGTGYCERIIDNQGEITSGTC